MKLSQSRNLLPIPIFSISFRHGQGEKWTLLHYLGYFLTYFVECRAHYYYRPTETRANCRRSGRVPKSTGADAIPTTELAKVIRKLDENMTVVNAKFSDMEKSVAAELKAQAADFCHWFVYARLESGASSWLENLRLIVAVMITAVGGTAGTLVYNYLITHPHLQAISKQLRPESPPGGTQKGEGEDLPVTDPSNRLDTERGGAREDLPVPTPGESVVLKPPNLNHPRG
ncbi:hypothetical protein V8E54_002361 [Elaphomyces granulatus]